MSCSTPSNGWTQIGIQLFQGANLAAFAVQMPLSLLNICVLLRTQILHPNLRFVLLTQSAAFFVNGASRGTQIVKMMAFGIEQWNDKGILQIVMVFVQVFQSFPGYFMVIERMIAIFRAKSYEQRTKPYFSIGWFIPTFTYCVLNALQENADRVKLLQSSSQRDVLPNINSSTMFAVYVCIVFSILEMIAFWLLNDRNYRSWLNRTQARQTLSQRYQLAENIRTARQLSPAIVLHFVNIVISLPLCFMMFYNWLHDFPTLVLNYAAQSLVYAVNNGLTEFTLINRHPLLRKNALQTLRAFGRFVFGLSNNQIGASDVPQIVIESIEGQRLEIGVRSDEMERHFQMLKREWEY